MRHTLPCLPFILVSLAVGACGVTDHPAPGQSAPAASAAAIRTGGLEVLRLSPPTDANVTVADGACHIKSPDGYLDAWLAKGAKSLDEAVGLVPTTIASEFKGFKQTASHPFPGGPGGAPAVRLAGSGVEADDNDPGTADVIVFQAGPRYFIACTHGESLRPTTQALLVKLVQTAAVP